MRAGSAQQVQLFLSYAHEDNAWLMELKAHIGYLINRGMVGAFSDQELQLGDEWEAAISKYLHEADIFVALISKSFLNSKYCSITEIDMALAEYDRRGAYIIPIVVEPCDWESLPLSRFDTRPIDGGKNIKPLSLWDNPHVALANIARELRQLVEKIDSNRSTEREPTIPISHAVQGGSLITDHAALAATIKGPSLQKSCKHARVRL